MAPSQCVPSHFSSCRSPCHYRSSCPTYRSNCLDYESSPLARICERKFELKVKCRLKRDCDIAITCFLVDCASGQRSSDLVNGIWVELCVSMMQCSAVRRGKSLRKTHETFFQRPLPATVSIASALRNEIEFRKTC